MPRAAPAWERGRVGFEPSPLVTGQIDAYMGWIVNQPFLIEKTGEESRRLLLADNPGVQFYAMVPFVTKDMIARKPNVVEKFTRASMKGWTRPCRAASAGCAAAPR